MKDEKGDLAIIIMVGCVWLITLILAYFVGAEGSRIDTQNNYAKFMRERGYMKYEITDEGLPYSVFLNVKTGEFEQAK